MILNVTQATCIFCLNPPKISCLLHDSLSIPPQKLTSPTSLPIKKKKLTSAQLQDCRVYVTIVTKFFFLHHKCITNHFLLFLVEELSFEYPIDFSLYNNLTLTHMVPLMSIYLSKLYLPFSRLTPSNLKVIQLTFSSQS